MLRRKGRAGASGANCGDEQPRGRGWGPFTGRQLTVIVCVAIVTAVAIPTAAIAAVGTFTSTTATPAVTGTNSSVAHDAKGVLGVASATNAERRFGVFGTAGGSLGVGVWGTGTKWGVYSNGPLGVAAGKSLTCTGCVSNTDLAANAAPGRLIYQSSVHFHGPWRSSTVASFTVPAGEMCVSGEASAFTTTTGGGSLAVFFANAAGSIIRFEVTTNEALSHKTLVSDGTTCGQVIAGTYSYFAVNESPDTTSDSNDFGSISVQVFSQ